MLQNKFPEREQEKQISYLRIYTTEKRANKKLKKRIKNKKKEAQLENTSMDLTTV